MRNAFAQIPPFRGLGDEEKLTAARDRLSNTQSGGDVELLAKACAVASAQDGDLAGGCIVTRWKNERGWTRTLQDESNDGTGKTDFG